MTREYQIAALQRLVERLRRRVAFVEASRFWTLRDVWLRARARVGLPAADEPPAIPPMEFAEAMAPFEPYTRWLLENEPRAADLSRLRDVGSSLRWTPAIAVIVDDAEEPADRALEAACAQAYAATTVLRTSALAPHPRRWERLNAALATCEAEIVAFCDAGTLLAPHATFEIALGFNLDPQAVAAYGDRDVIEPSGARSEPTFAPDWSPETFLSQMYTGPLIFYRRAALERHGGFRPGCGAALHYDLALRVLDGCERVVHRASILSHALRSHAVPDAVAASDADRVVAEALARRGDAARIEPSECPGVRIVRYAPAASETIEVLIPTRDLSEKLERCLESVYARNTGLDLRVTVIDNGSIEAETARVLRDFAERGGRRFRVLRIDEPFNFSRLVNAAARASEAAYLLLLNNDAQFVTDGAIAALHEHASRPQIGAVGARLLYEDGALQHAGVVVGIGGLAGHVYRGAEPAFASRHASIAGLRNYAAVTAACLMVRRSSFDAVGGFDERLAVEFNDIDFCLKLRDLGLRNLYLPHVVLRHDESSSRGKLDRSAASLRDRELFRELWRSDVFRDPYYNANLTLEREDASIAL